MIKLWLIDEEEKEAISNAFISKSKDLKNFSIIQCPHDLIFFKNFKKIIELDKNSSYGGLSPRITHIGFLYWISILPILLKEFHHFLIRKKWKKIYLSLGLDMFFYPKSINFFTKIKYFYKATLTFIALKSKKDILKHRFNGILCGDLIYDSYLRFNKKPTLNIFDFTLILFIYECYFQIMYYEKLCKKHKIDKYYSTYSTYIPHGIPVRVFLKNGIQVFTIAYSNNDELKIKQLSIDDTYQVSPHWNFRKIFNTLNNKENLIENALYEFGKRFEGINDLTYMKSNQYSNDYNSSKINIENFDGVVFIGDFFDSQHIYRSIIFNDLYEWLIHTIELTKKNKLNIGFKTHPNQSLGSKIIIDKIKSSFPTIQWISSNVSNKIIFRSGIKFGVSVYGTVLPELAFHNIIPICCGDNPASNYDFIFQAKNKKEYDDLINNYNTIQFPKNSKKQLGEFFHMNNIHFSNMR